MEGLNAPVRTWDGDKWRLTHPQLREEPNATQEDVNGLWWLSDKSRWGSDGTRNRNMDTYKGTLFMAIQSGIYISFDISDPDNPTPLDSLDVPGVLGNRITDDGYAMVGPSYASVGEDDRLKVIDVSDPSNMSLVTMVQSDMINAGAHGICLGPDQDYLYITTWGSDPNGVASVDISDRENPVFVDHVTFNAAHDLAIESSGSYAFCSTHESKMFSIDISDPANMQVLDELDYTTLEQGSGARLSDDENYFFFGAGLPVGQTFVIDVTDPNNLAEVGSSAPFSYRYRIDGNRLYGVSGTQWDNSAVNVWDISDPPNIDYLGRAASHTEGYTELELHPRTDHIYAAGAGSSTHKLSVVRPRYRRKLWEMNLGSGTAWGVSGAGGQVYINDTGGPLLGVGPRFGDTQWDADIGSSQDMAYIGQEIFAGDGNAVAQIDAETGAVTASHTEHSSTVYGITAINGMAISGSPDGTVVAYDFDTETVAWNQTVDSGDGVASVDSNDGVIYVGTYGENLIALDPSDGSEIWRHTEHGNNVWSIAAADDYIFSGSHDETVLAYDPGTDPTGTDPGTVEWSHSLQGDNVTDVIARKDWVASSSVDGTVQIVDRSDGSDRDSHSLHTDGVYSLGYLNGVLVSGDQSANVIAWG